MKAMFFAIIVIASFVIGLVFGVFGRVNSFQRNEIADKNIEIYYDNNIEKIENNDKLVCEPNTTCSEILSPVAINENEEISNLRNRFGVQKGPVDRIKENQIQVFNDKVVIYLHNAEWASFTPTGSMEPVLNEYANAIQIIPKSEKDINVGDIISYESEYAEGIIIHRVVEVGYDKEGWYCIAKGDNNPKKDPGKIRFPQIKRVLVAIIY